jgi:hypothetical protein
MRSPEAALMQIIPGFDIVRPEFKCAERGEKARARLDLRGGVGMGIGRRGSTPIG